jgi:poly(hydroxyalkanoate) granule-associated protein
MVSSKHSTNPDPDPSSPFDSPLGRAVRDSAQQIWLAGLGAFAKAQDEGAKAFDNLVREGAEMQRKTQSAAEDRFGGLAGGLADKVSAMADQVGAKAGAQWDKLESIFEQRTARALERLGVPTSADLARLAQRVDTLTAAVEALTVQSQAAARSRAIAAKKPKASLKPAVKAGAKRASKSA